MSIYFDTKDFYRTINFFKKKDNWVDILETAANNVADDIESDAKTKVYQGGLKKRTGDLADSIGIAVQIEGNVVVLILGSSHPAAAIIEYGGYSPMPVEFAPYVGATYSDRLLESAKGYGKDPYVVARGIEKNQPFAEPRPFIRPALMEGKGAIESEIWNVARKLAP